MKKTILFLLSLIAVSFLIVAIKDFCFNVKTEMLMENLEKMTECLEESEKSEEVEFQKFQDGVLGMIIIPKIEIEAPIKEGTGLEVLKYTVRTFRKYPIMEAEMLPWHLIMKAHMLTIFQE